MTLAVRPAAVSGAGRALPRALLGGCAVATRCGYARCAGPHGELREQDDQVVERSVND